MEEESARSKLHRRTSAWARHKPACLSALYFSSRSTFFSAYPYRMVQVNLGVFHNAAQARPLLLSAAAALSVVRLHLRKLSPVFVSGPLSDEILGVWVALCQGSARRGRRVALP